MRILGRDAKNHRFSDANKAERFDVKVFYSFLNDIISSTYNYV